MNGIVIVDKPQDWTSQDVTARLRRVFNTRRIGHGGTLDPMATGVLPVFVGRATRGVEFFEHAEKIYEATIRLGLTTDTEDVTGTVLTEQEAKISEQDFLEMYQNGELFEVTNYANHFYGSRKEDVRSILDSGRHALTVMDICGAMSMKTHFPNVVTIYVKRDKSDILTAILEKEITVQEKVNRLLSLESERKNAEVCDYVVEFDTCERAVKQIMDKLDIR